MKKPLPLSPTYCVSPALSAHDFADAARLGFGTIIHFQTDDEAGSLTVKVARQAALAHGLTFLHIPASKYDLLSADLLAKVRLALDSASGRVLGTCASGQRAAIVWAGAMARKMPVPDILKALSQAGLDLSFLRDDLESEAHRALWAGAVPAEPSKAAA